jgi:uncharacterized OB-fold protein
MQFSMQIDGDHMKLDFIDFPGGHDSRRVRPYITPEIKQHYDALCDGILVLPECAACGLVGVPSGPCCMRCGSMRRNWRQCSGRGVVHSWVRYHRAYLPEFNDLVPYAVITARLEEGPTMFGRWLSGQRTPRFDAPIRGVIEKWADGFCGLAFEEAP